MSAAVPRVFVDDDGDGFQLEVRPLADGAFVLALAPTPQALRQAADERAAERARGYAVDDTNPLHTVWLAGIRVRMPMIGGGSHPALYFALATWFRQTRPRAVRAPRGLRPSRATTRPSPDPVAPHAADAAAGDRLAWRVVADADDRGYELRVLQSRDSDFWLSIKPTDAQIRQEMAAERAAVARGEPWVPPPHLVHGAVVSVRPSGPPGHAALVTQLTTLIRPPAGLPARAP